MEGGKLLSPSLATVNLPQPQPMPLSFEYFLGFSISCEGITQGSRKCEKDSSIRVKEEESVSRGWGRQRDCYRERDRLRDKDVCIVYLCVCVFVEKERQKETEAERQSEIITVLYYHLRDQSHYRI